MPKLSELSDIEFNNEQIERIVFSGLEDNGASSKYAFVFGHAMLINERTSKAVEVYKQGRIKKLVFLGGGYGDSNISEDHIPEANKMRDLAISLGVKPEDIIIEDKSTNTYENVIYGLEMLSNDNFDTLMLITSEFHLKRCMLLLKRNLPNINLILVSVKDGIHDKENWLSHDNLWDNNGKHGSGKSLVTNEAKILVNGAINGQLADLEVEI